MNCKCGNRLNWNDGAYCKACMEKAKENSRLKNTEGNTITNHTLTESDKHLLAEGVTMDFKLTTQEKRDLLIFLDEYCPACSIDEQRSFQTLQDRHDLAVALGKKGLWGGFLQFSKGEFEIETNSDRSTLQQYYGDFIYWLMVSELERFAWLCCQFTKGEKEAEHEQE